MKKRRYPDTKKRDGRQRGKGSPSLKRENNKRYGKKRKQREAFRRKKRRLPIALPITKTGERDTTWLGNLAVTRLLQQGGARTI